MYINKLKTFADNSNVICQLPFLKLQTLKIKQNIFGRVHGIVFLLKKNNLFRFCKPYQSEFKYKHDGRKCNCE